LANVILSVFKIPIISAKFAEVAGLIPFTVPAVPPTTVIVGAVPVPVAAKFVLFPTVEAVKTTLPAPKLAPVEYPVNEPE